MQCNSEETLVATTNDLKNGMVLNLEGQPVSYTHLTLPTNREV